MGCAAFKLVVTGGHVQKDGVRGARRGLGVKCPDKRGELAVYD